MNILSGEAFQQLCPVYCGNHYDLHRNPKIASQPEKHIRIDLLDHEWDNPSLIFCYSCALQTFMEKLYFLKNPFILVSHNEDTNITKEYLPIAEYSLVCHWFAQNVMIEHPKLSMIPIGIANQMWPHGNTSILHMCMEISKNIAKVNDFYFYFSTHTNANLRLPCKSTLESKGLNFGIELPFPYYLQTLATHKFAISPPGNGVDCHRIWECYYMGVIPIVLESTFTRILEKELPCIVLKSWEDFDAQQCLNQYKHLKQKLNESLSKLSLDYYKHKIMDAQTSISLPKTTMNVVYAFIGPLPTYAIDTVYQLRLFYDGPVYFIVNDTTSDIANILRSNYNVTLIDYITVKDAAFNDIVQRSYHKFCIVNNLTGREKLFIYCFERFFILRNLMEQKSLKDVFFIELDNLVYDDPRKWLEGFQKSDFTFMFDNHERCASGVCYIKEYTHLEPFTNYCAEFILYSTKFMTEMTTLYEFWQRNKSTTLLLPIYWKDTTVPIESCENYGMFGDTIFDAASMGIYLGGMDPHHTNGVIVKGLKGTWSAIDYTKCTFKWENDEKDRRIPYILGPNNTWIKINNLHIHSKDLKSCLSKDINRS